MKLPYHENALVAQRKITQYLLSESHEYGKSKAAFFLRFGFSVAQWEVMQDALLAHAAEHSVASVLDTSRGKTLCCGGKTRYTLWQTALGTHHLGIGNHQRDTALDYGVSAKAKDGEDHDPGT